MRLACREKALSCRIGGPASWFFRVHGDSGCDIEHPEAGLSPVHLISRLFLHRTSSPSPSMPSCVQKRPRLRGNRVATQHETPDIATRPRRGPEKPARRSVDTASRDNPSTDYSAREGLFAHNLVVFGDGWWCSAELGGALWRPAISGAWWCLVALGGWRCPAAPGARGKSARACFRGRRGQRTPQASCEFSRS